LVTGRGAAGLPIVRFVTGAAFILHGWPKIQNAFGWMILLVGPGSLSIDGLLFGPSLRKEAIEDRAT
jgi:hypothetical protein